MRLDSCGAMVFQVQINDLHRESKIVNLTDDEARANSKMCETVGVWGVVRWIHADATAPHLKRSDIGQE